jgi:hypothetical protein
MLAACGLGATCLIASVANTRLTIKRDNVRNLGEAIVQEFIALPQIRGVGTPRLGASKTTPQKRG